MKKNQKGQSVLEYTLLLAAIIAVLLLVLFGSGGFKDKAKSVYDKVGDVMNNTTNNLPGVLGP